MRRYIQQQFVYTYVVAPLRQMPARALMQGRQGRPCYKRAVSYRRSNSSTETIRFTIEHDSERYHPQPGDGR